MTTKDELACVYAALILADDNIEITSAKLETIIKAAGVDVEPLWPNLFAKALESVNVRDLITNVSSAAPVAAAGPAVTAGGGEAAEEEKKEAAPVEEEEESDDDMGFGLFD